MTKVQLKRKVFFLSLAILLALCLRLFFIGVSVTRAPASCDESVLVLTAKDVRQGEWPLLVKGYPYQLPIESYLYAPFVNLLPRTAAGVRWSLFFLELAATAVFFLILRRLGMWRDTWPGIALLLFPSAYLLMFQSACPIPQYSAMTLLCAAALWLAVREPATDRGAVAVAAGSGFSSGLAFSNHMPALAVVIPLALFFCLRPTRRRSLLSGAAFSAALLVGLIPFLLATFTIPHAYEGVTGTLTWRELAQPPFRLSTLGLALQAALGISPCIYTDWKTRLPAIPWLHYPALLAWLLLVLAITGLRIVRLWQRTREQGRVVLQFADLLVGIAWLTPALFLVSGRTAYHTPRFLLPLLWVLPLLLSCLYAQASRMWRRALAAVAVLLVLLNLVGSARLIAFWMRCEFTQTQKFYLDVQPALEYLKAKGITHCYASSPDAYRINFETDERILCAPAYQQHFPKWPVPYKEEVRAATNIAFVLANHMYLKPSHFEPHLQFMEMSAQCHTAGQFKVYTDFRLNRPFPEHRIPPNTVKASSDRRFEFRWTGPRLLSRLVLRYEERFAHQPHSYRILAHTPVGWVPVAADIPLCLDPFELLNGHPDYGAHLQTIRVPPIETDGVRLEVAPPGDLEDKTNCFADVEFYYAATNQPSEHAP